MKINFITGLLLLTKISFAQVPTTWTVNPADFTNQMYISAKANEACVDLANVNNYVAAFVGSQCRGVAQTSIVAGTNYLGNLTVNSNAASGEKVKFQIYNSCYLLLVTCYFVCYPCTCARIFNRGVFWLWQDNQPG